MVKSTTTTCQGTTFSKDFTSAKRGAKYSSITLANDNDCITGNMIVTVNTDAIAATPTDAWYPHTRDQWFRADNGVWVQYPSKLNNISAGSHSIQVRYKNCIDSARVTLSERIPIRVGSVAIGNQNDCIKGNATATITALNTLGSIRYALGSGAYQLSNPTFSALSSGNYLAKVLDDGGCKDSLAFSVLENEPPLASIAGVNALCAGQSTTLSASGGTAYLWSTGATTAAITITPSVNTTYTVTVTQNGCSAVVSKTITVTPTPTITGVTSLCAGQSTTLTASTGSSYLWSTGATTAAITITPAATTTYTVTVTQSGCSLAASQVVTVTPYPIPVITGASTLCSGQPASLTASGGTAYLWSTGATTASISPTPIANTTYSVTVSQNGCSATASKAITVTALPTPLITGVQNICAGQSTTLTASGGTTYLWSTGATTAAVSLTPSATTTYSVTVTQNGCSAVTSKQVNVTPVPTITGVTSICSSQSTTLTASTGSSYTWSTGSINATISVTPTTNTTYSVTVTQNGCTAVASQLVTVTPYPSPTIAGASILCAGQSTTLSVGAAAGYSYSWSTGETTSSITATPATTTTYSVTVSQNGCASGSSINISVWPLPTPAISGVSSICAGQSATLTASGGTAYLWSTGATTAAITATPSSTATYTVTVTQNGCSATASKQLSVTPLPTISGVSTVCAGQPAALTASSGSTYLWSTGATTASISPTPTANATYTVTVTLNGCSASASKSVAVTPLPTASIVGSSTICAGQPANLTASGGTAYAWSTGATTAAISPSPAVTTTYTVTVTQNGCSAVASQVVNVTPLPTPIITGVSTICAGQTTTLTASGGTTYLWSTGATTAAISPNPATNTTYSVTVTQNGCSAVTSQVVGVNPYPTPSISGVSTVCIGQPAALTASGGNGYQWSTGATTASISPTPTANTTYTVTVTLNGCSASASKSVVVTPLPTASIVGPATICAGQPATLTASGGTAYLWSTGATTAAISPSPAVTTTYTVTVTQNGCSAVASQVVNVTPLPTPIISGVSTICAGQTTTLTASGGTTYLWSTGATTAAISPNPATNTTYSVTVTQNGCSAVTSQVVGVNPYPTPSISGVSTVCNGQPVTLTASGGNGYQWSTGATTAAISPTPTANTTYTVTVTLNGCSASASKSVVVTPLPTASIVGSATICAGQPANLTASGGTAYLWSTGATTAAISPSPAVTTTYTVTVTQNGCSAVASQVVNVTPLPTPIISGVSTICAGQPANLTASGGTAYAWSTGATTAAISPSPTAATTYTVTVSQNGCNATASKQVTVTPLPIAAISGVSSICNGQPANLTASGGTAYAWSTGATTAAIAPTPSANTTYTVTVTTNGCTSTTSQAVVVKALPLVAISGPSAVCQGQSASLSSVYTADSYLWSNGATTAGVSVAPGAYSLTVTTNGCSNSAGFSVSVIQTTGASISGPASICLGSTARLTASGSGTYQWSNGSTASFIDVTPTAPGTYQYSVNSFTNGCPGLPGVYTLTVPAPLTLTYQLQNDQDCTPNNTGIIPIATNAQGAVSYIISPLGTTDFSIDLQGKGSGKYTLSGIDTKGCTASTMIDIKEAQPVTLSYQLDNPDDCIKGNASLRVRALTGNGSIAITLGGYSVPNGLFTLGSGTYQFQALDSIGCSASLSVTIDEKLPTFTVAQGNLQDCDPNNTQLTINGNSARGALLYKLDQGSTQTDPFFSNVPVGIHKLSLTDTKGCRDSVTVVVENNCLVDYDYTGVSSCDTTDGELVIYPINNGGSQQFSIDNGVNWTNSYSFKGLAPGNYTPAIKKLPLGCVIYGDSIAISDTCQRYAVAAFTKDTLLITNPHQLVRFPWKIQTPRWMHRDSFGLKLQLKGDGAPHFIEYNVDGGSLATLRGERLFAQRLYRNGFSGLDRDSTDLASTAGLFKYPQDYVFTLTSDNPSKLKVDPDHGTLRVVVLLDADSDTYSEQPLIICKGESVTLNPGLGSCFNWNDGSFEGSRTITPTHDTTYSVTILDDQLRQTIKVYHIKVVNLMVKIIPTDAQKRTCTAEPVKLTAQVSGAPNAQLIQYRWNTGETTASVTISSSKPYTPATRTVTVTYVIAPGQICSTVASVDVAKLFENQDANICDNIYDKMTALGFEGVPCNIIPKLPFSFPQLRGSAPVINYGHYDVVYVDINIPLESKLTKIINILRSKGLNATGYITDADNVCNGSDFDAVKTLFEQDLEDYDVWIHVIKCDNEGNGYYFIKFNNQLINQNDIFRALIDDRINQIDTYPAYQFYLLAASTLDNSISFSPENFDPIFDQKTLIDKGQGLLNAGIATLKPGGPVVLKSKEFGSGDVIDFYVQLAYKKNKDEPIKLIDQTQHYSFNWFINGVEITSIANNTNPSITEMLNFINEGNNILMLKITKKPESTSKTMLSQEITIPILYIPLPSNPIESIRIRVTVNGKLKDIYKPGESIGDEIRGDKPLIEGDNISVQLGRLGNDGVSFEMVNRGELLYNETTVRNGMALNFIFRVSNTNLLEATLNASTRAAFQFVGKRKPIIINTTSNATNPFPAPLETSAFNGSNMTGEGIKTFKDRYIKALVKLKRSIPDIYNYFSNDFVVDIKINKDPNSVVAGHATNNLEPNNDIFPFLALINPYFELEEQVDPDNPNNRIQVNVIKNADIICYITNVEQKALVIASNLRRITEQADEIINKVSNYNPDNGNTLRQSILNGNFVEIPAITERFSYAISIQHGFSITNEEAKQILYPSQPGIITINKSLQPDALDLAKTMAHELAHIKFAIDSPLEKLKWFLIWKNHVARRWNIGADEPSNRIIYGTCSLGEGHERGSNESGIVCGLESTIK